MIEHLPNDDEPLDKVELCIIAAFIVFCVCAVLPAASEDHRPETAFHALRQIEADEERLSPDDDQYFNPCLSSRQRAFIQDWNATQKYEPTIQVNANTDN